MLIQAALTAVAIVAAAYTTSFITWQIVIYLDERGSHDTSN